MVIGVVLLLVGAAILWLGAETAVRGAARLARALGIPAFVLGAILFGVDVEGIGAAAVAAGRGETAVASGSIFGSVVFLFSAAFGAALLVSREPVRSPPILMVLAPAVPLTAAAFVISDRFVTRGEGLILLAVYGAYLTLLIHEASGAAVEDADDGGEPDARPPIADAIEESLEERVAEPSPRATRGRLALRTIAGLAILSAGAFVLVVGGERILDRTGLSAGFVGAAIIGALASLDEVALEILPIRRGTPELATGNLFGTLAAFTSGVLGVIGLARPLLLDPGVVTAFLAMAFLYAVVAIAFVTRGRAGGLLGAFVLAGYGAWLVVSSAV